MDSIQRGCQLDHVLEATIRNGRGESRPCSRDVNSELFRFALGGCGQAGFIEDLTMQTSRWEPESHTVSVAHESIGDFIDFLESLGAFGVDTYNAFYTKGPIVSEVGFYSAQAAEEFENCLSVSNSGGGRIRRDRIRHAQFHFHRRRKQWVRAFPDHYRLWTDYIFDYGGLRDFTRQLFAREIKTSCIKAMYFLVVRRPEDAVRFPFFPVRPGETGYSVGLYGMVHPDRLLDLGRGVAELRAIQELALRFGGRPYRHGRFEGDPETLRRLYGVDLDRLRVLSEEGAFRPDPGPLV